MSIAVVNIKGTANERPPRPYETWTEFWEGHTGKKFGKCSNVNCCADAEDGAHVKPYGIIGQHRYITPLCRMCNKSDDIIYVEKESLVQID